MIGDLRPRAIAVLCALRQGGLTEDELRDRIGDPPAHNVHDLLDNMRELGLVGQPPTDERWYLDLAGVGWLQTRGLGAAPEAGLSNRPLGAKL